jgi:hypothetical protein
MIFLPQNMAKTMNRVILFFAALIVLSIDGNCQNYYYKKYGVKELNQLTQDQLANELKLNKKAVVFSIGALVVGTSFIILGSYLNNEANKELTTIEDVEAWPFEKVLGIVFITSGSAVDLCGLFLLPYSSIKIDKIKRLLSNSEVKLGFINRATYGMYNRSNMSLTPGISLTVNF